MRVGIVILPQLPWREQRHLWRRAEEYGFATAYTYDHLSWRSLTDEPWGATIPTLTAAATATERIGIGTFVASPNFRHPVPFAKDIATLDDISGGRVVLGLGAGGTGFDATVLGGSVLEPKPRHGRFIDFAETLDVLLRGETDGPISHHGPWFTAHETRMVGEPTRTPRVPFLIAANGPRGLRLAARLGQGWVTTGADGATGEDWWNSVARLSTRMDETLAATGRTEPLERVLSLDSGGYSLTSAAHYRDAVARAESLGFTEVVVHWPRPDGIYAGSDSILDEIAPNV
ncbi:LLM class flavin-dependent oxidoreductase [Microbacterium gorillae]|uniref:LLM class flavin-dependent oxidoreductase n=1 Tax=Microbacterium gorillae TaxID=1231063 RepID=UPI0005907746|nr:LLM class flavin-dependent oxidoreductase [Microbacterium gorillae]